ncbi:glycosyltransferase family 2 protein [Calothrix sp. CCY 0018]|uniref:glycosyltransferase family 2 protein n=1 Tax=Calothrix sp. CCY 0018 TaxID=3103864 RepID=UPI0039C72A52
MPYPKVTLIVVPNQCFNYTQKSLESIYQYTDIPFKLIYVDGYSPSKVKQYLEVQSQEKGFRLIRTEKYVSPNHARNIGLQHVDTEYVVFINNDVLVTTDWLNNLMQCAQETGSPVVSPVCLQGTLENMNIHSAGGCLEFQYKDGNLDLFEKRTFVKNSFDRVQPLLSRKPTQIIDFNCVLVRTSFLSKIDKLDEDIVNFAQDIDFSLSVFAVGGTIYLEPESIVNYLPVAELKFSDMPYYLLIWNYVWKRKSINYFQEKWGLAKDAKFISDALGQISEDTTLPVRSLLELTKQLYVNEGDRINPKNFKRS